MYTIYTYTHAHMYKNTCTHTILERNTDRQTERGTRTHINNKYDLTYINILFFVSSVWTYSHSTTNMDEDSSVRTFLPMWHADVALCLLLRSFAGCRCTMPQRSKPGQRWWQRCCTHTLTLRAKLTWYVAGLMWGAVWLASAYVLLYSLLVFVRVRSVPRGGFVQY